MSYSCNSDLVPRKDLFYWSEPRPATRVSFIAVASDGKVVSKKQHFLTKHGKIDWGELKTLTNLPLVEATVSGLGGGDGGSDPGTFFSIPLEAGGCVDLPECSELAEDTYLVLAIVSRHRRLTRRAQAGTASRTTRRVKQV